MKDAAGIHLFDTHCHLHDQKLLEHIYDVVHRAKAAGVVRMLCCGTAEDDWVQVLDLVSRFPRVTPALGLHPLFVAKRSPKWFDTLAALVKTSAAVIGEIGLDHAVKPRHDKDQEEVFLRQLELAREFNRPVSIHCREAWGRMPDLLLSPGIPKAGAVIHSYSGGPDSVKALTDAGVYLSFSGSLTRPNNRRGCDAVPLVPWDRLLVETDSPDIMPMIGAEWPAKGAVNEPANMVHVVAKMAELRGVTPEEVAKCTWENSCRLFGEGKLGSAAERTPNVQRSTLNVQG